MTTWYKLEHQTLTAKTTVVAVPQHENEYWINFRTKNKVVMPDWMLYPCVSSWFLRMSLQRGS